MISPQRSNPTESEILAPLNSPQREAVTWGGGPLLVLSGAGSGKTRVITHRIAHLVLVQGVSAGRIVAVTFTNKAAGEMRARVETLLGNPPAGAWVGTFHALCLRILRRDGTRIGLGRGFNVYDSADQLSVVKRILKEEVGEDASVSPRSFLSRISRAKNAMETPDELERRAHTHDMKLAVHIHRRYLDALSQANAVDFDDLLLKTLELFREHPDVLEGYASRCEHLLVDEYQDTNRPQYLLVRALSSVHENVCIVGDEDQCIYRFRGAELRNILDFEADHPGTHVIRLEQNYRSSAAILEAAGALIANNRLRKGKTLWTERPAGEPLELYHAPDDRDEAEWVSIRVREFEARTPFEGMAVLYRTNAQSRLVEEIFRRDRIPYQVVGSVQFYERKEVKDVLAYLKLVANPADDVAFRRVVNTPPRGIGDTTLAALEELRAERGIPLLEASRTALEEGRVASRSARMLRGFLDLVADLTGRAADGVPALVERVIEATEYEKYLEKTYGILATERVENVRALLSAAVEHAEESGEPTLEDFLDRSALVSDADEIGREPGVTLMTVHCAKGLEFPIVFLVGLEETLFPHAMASEYPEDLEEERRLCYVAMTRARERLLLAHAHNRRLRGSYLPNPPSRFLEEIPRRLVRETGTRARPSAFFDAWSPKPVRSVGSSAARPEARRPAPSVVAPVAVPPQPAGPPPEDGFAVGRFVKHPRFGAGRILAREGSGKNLKLTIQFGGDPPKKILPAYTKLLVEV